MTTQEAIRTMEYFDCNFGDYKPNHEAITGMQEGSANTMDFCLSILSVLDDSKGDEIDC